MWSVGAQIDRRMNIDGEDLPGSLSATAFVAWYNGHPDYCDVEIDLDVERVVVVGNGNVALDCARMLALTREELAVTDTADVAIDAIADSPIREIVVLGRRGPVQAAFTTPELQELGELADADVWVDPADMELDPASEAALAGEGMALTAAQRRRAAHVRGARADGQAAAGAPAVPGVAGRAARRRPRGGGRDRAQPPGGRRGRQPARRADRRDRGLPAGLVLRSVGYRGTPLEGVPFDERRHLIPNEDGRVLDAEGRVLPGEYCAGWIKRGPSGVIGTNKKDASESIELLLEDAEAGRLREPEEPSAEAIERLVWERADHVVEYAGWQAIDEHERGSGEPHGRPRVKLTRWEHLLDRARSASSTR